MRYVQLATQIHILFYETKKNSPFNYNHKTFQQKKKSRN